jgi:hypothetical protein
MDFKSPIVYSKQKDHTLIPKQTWIPIHLLYTHNKTKYKKSRLHFIKLINIFFLQIILQDKYNIGVSTVNIQFMWLGTKRLKRLHLKSFLITGMYIWSEVLIFYTWFCYVCTADELESMFVLGSKCDLFVMSVQWVTWNP